MDICLSMFDIGHGTVAQNYLKTQTPDVLNFFLKKVFSDVLFEIHIFHIFVHIFSIGQFVRTLKIYILACRYVRESWIRLCCFYFSFRP